MSNLFAVSSLIAKTMTEFFVQKSPLLNSANREYLEQFSQQNYATGGTINIKVPGYTTVEQGLAVTATGIQDFTIPFAITENDIYSVTRQLNLFEQRFDILGGTQALTAPIKKAIVDNYAYPAYQSLEASLELTAAFDLKTTAYLTPIDTVDKLGSVNDYTSLANLEALCQLLQLDSERYLMMNVPDATQVTTSLQNMFNQMINKNITMNARVGGPDKGRLAGFDVYRSNQLLKHIAGPLAGSTGITVSNVAVDGTTITLTGVPSTTAVLIKAGDRISIPSVNILQPITYQVLDTKLVVTAAADANGDGAGNVQFTVSYPLMASGEHANVSALPAVNAPVFIFPDRNVNYAYVKSGLSAVPLPLGDIYGATNSNVKGENLVPVKVVLQGNVSSFSNIFRISQLVGIRAFAPYVVELPSLAA